MKEQKKYLLAQEEYEKALQLFPKSAEALQGLERIKSRKKSIEKNTVKSR